MLRCVLAFIVLVLGPGSATADTPKEAPGALRPSTAPIDYNASLDSPEWWRYVGATGVVVGMNIVVYWVPSKYILKADWADINLSTIKENFTTGFVIDNDFFSTNQFGHPYQGATYHSAGRVFGLDFYRSASMAFLGSLQWELFMENEPPSFNDLVTTTIGGIAFGELQFRLANLVLDDSSRGGERFGREALALLINPVLGVSRLVHSKSWQAGPSHQTPPTTARLKTGVDGLLTTADDDKRVVVALETRYGRIRDLRPRIRPFQYFDFEIALAFSKDQPGSLLYVNAILEGRKFSWWGTGNATYAWVHNFDYFHSEAVDVGSAATGVGIAAEFAISGDLELNFYSNLVGTFGAVTNDLPESPLERDYNFGVGASVRAKMELEHQKYGRLHLLNYRYWFHTVWGLDGEELAGFHRFGYSLPITKGFGVGANATWFSKRGYYEAANTRLGDWRLDLRLEFKLD